MKSLHEIQQEIKDWSFAQFGQNPSRNVTSPSHGQLLGSLPALLGIQEELGELCRAVARRHQGRGYENYEEYMEAVRDACADLLVFLCDFASREGVDLQQSLNTVWAKVSRRRREQWAADKAKEQPPKDPDTRTVAEVLAARNSVAGCCSTHADNQACDCLQRAKERERAQKRRRIRQDPETKEGWEDPTIPPGDRSGV